MVPVFKGSRMVPVSRILAPFNVRVIRLGDSPEFLVQCSKVFLLSSFNVLETVDYKIIPL